MPITQLRTGDTGESTPNTGLYTGRKLRDAQLPRPLIAEAAVREPERQLHENGELASVTEFDVTGVPRKITAYDEELDALGQPVVASEVHFLGGDQHDPDANTPAVRSWKGGKPVLEMRLTHGTLQDPADGSPAVRAHGDDREMLHIHYAGGKVQDPAPGVPAHVATLPDGSSRSTFYTQGVVTEQQDRFPNPLNGILPGDIVITRKAK